VVKFKRSVDTKYRWRKVYEDRTVVAGALRFGMDLNKIRSPGRFGIKNVGNGIVPAASLPNDEVFRTDDGKVHLLLVDPGFSANIGRKHQAGIVRWFDLSDGSAEFNRKFSVSTPDVDPISTLPPVNGKPKWIVKLGPG